MKIKALAITFALIICVVSCIALSPAETSAKNAPVVAAVSVQLPSANDSSEILKARFLNMLNHNFVYGEDFKYIDEMINLSTIALLDSAEEENPEFIKEDVVFSYISDMFGVEVADASGLNAEYPKKEGYIYIIPRGYTVYTHKNADVVRNEDGSYTVTTDVTVSGHDTEDETVKAVSLFVKNENSGFGFNLISSKIVENTVQM